MRVTIGIIATGLLVAFVARRFIISFSGLTLTLPNETRYVSYNVIVFWMLIAITILLSILRWGRE
jgi:hypothetical protein